MSAVTSSPVPDEPYIATGHRLTGSQAEAIAARVPRLAEYHVTTQVLAVRGVDRGSPWIENFLTPAERAAISAAIEAIAPRPETPAGIEILEAVR